MSMFLRFMCGPVIAKLQPSDVRGDDENDEGSDAPPIAVTMSYNEPVSSVIDRATQQLDEEEAIRNRSEIAQREINKFETRIGIRQAKVREAQLKARRLTLEAEAPSLSQSSREAKRKLARQQLRVAHGDNLLIEQEQAALYKLQQIHSRHEQARLAAESTQALRSATKALRHELSSTNRHAVEDTFNEAQDNIAASDHLGALMSTTFSFNESGASALPEISDAELDQQLDDLVLEEPYDSTETPAAAAVAVLRMPSAPGANLGSGASRPNKRPVAAPMLATQ